MTEAELAAWLYEAQRRVRSIAFLGVHWTQVQYPIYPVQERLMGRDAAVPSLLQRIRTAGAGFKTALGLCCTVLWLRRRYRNVWTRIRAAGVDVVLRSFGRGENAEPPGYDFYYGDLQKRLRQAGVRALLLVGDSTSAPAARFASAQIEAGRSPRLPDKLMLAPWEPLLCYAAQLITSLDLWARTLAVPRSVLRSIFREAAWDVLSAETHVHSSYYFIGRRVGRAFRPTMLVTLYEGRSWERCMWEGIRASGSPCTIAGYQHAILFPYLRALLKPEQVAGRTTAPGIVLCRGPVTRDMLFPGHYRHQNRLVTFGSFRTKSQGADSPQVDPGARSVLVLPVGWEEESRLLFDFALDLAAACPDHQFRLRCHPVLPFEQVALKLRRQVSAASNVSVSRDRSLEADIAGASVVLYRGTSTVFEAVSAGLKPLYYAAPGLRNEDPLHGLCGWKESVFDLESARTALNRYASMTGLEAIQAAEPGIAYAASYSPPVSDDAVEWLADTASGRDHVRCPK